MPIPRLRGPASAAPQVGSARKGVYNTTRPGIRSKCTIQGMERTTMLQRQLGQLMINRIVESEHADFDPLAFFPETGPRRLGSTQGLAAAAWTINPACGNLSFPMQETRWLVRTRHHTILVDTCIGDHEKRQRPSWRMTTTCVPHAVGSPWRAPGTPSTVLSCARICMWIMSAGTHNGATDAGCQSLPNGYLRHSPQGMEVLGDGAPRHAWSTWRETHADCQRRVWPPLWPMTMPSMTRYGSNPHPGHTPDHVSVRLASNGAHAVITGDMIHSPV